MTGVRMTGWYRWVAVAALVVLSACGGGKKTTVPVPSASAATPVGAVGDGNLSTFSITGSNLRSALLIIDGCEDDPLVKGRTNQEIVFECVPVKVLLSIDVLDSNTLETVASLEADAKSVNDPTPNTTATPVGVVAFRARSTFAITGTKLANAQVGVAFGCSESSITIDSQTESEIRFSCTPNALEIRLNVSNRLGYLVGVVVANVPNPNLVPTITDIVSSHINDPVGYPPAKLGKSSTYDVIGDNLYYNLVDITAEGCGGLQIIRSAETESRIVGLVCTATTKTPVFKVVDITDPDADVKPELFSYTANFNSLPIEPLVIRSINNSVSQNPRVSVIRQNSLFVVNGYFGEATDAAAATAASVSSDGCTDFTVDAYDAALATYYFTCTPQRFDTSFSIKDQNDRELADLSFPIRVTFSIAVNGNTDDAKFLIVGLDYKKAPITVANFLSYVERGTDPSYYANTLFHRSLNGSNVATKVIQGGAFTTVEDSLTNTAKPGAGGTIPMESTLVTGLSNTRGTISMARTSDPNSATSQFFFNVSDNSSFYDATNTDPGYAVFGQVVTEGSLETLDLLNGISTDVNGTPSQEIRIINVIRTM